MAETCGRFIRLRSRALGLRSFMSSVDSIFGKLHNYALLRNIVSHGFRTTVLQLLYWSFILALVKRKSKRHPEACRSFAMARRATQSMLLPALPDMGMSLYPCYK